MKIVGHTFSEIVLNPAKDVLVLFTTENCPNCKKALRKITQVADHFARDPHVTVGVLDFLKNDIGHTRVERLPALRLYRRDGKA